MTPKLDMIGIVVSDMPKALAFYRRLGLDIAADQDTEPHVEITLAGGARLAWDASDMIRGIDPSWTPATGSPRIALAFACADPADVDRVYAHMVEAGYDGHKEPWDAFWGQRYAMLRDPDGNGVELFAALGGATSG